MKPVAVRPVAGDRAWSGVAAVAQIGSDESHSGGSRPQRTRRDAVKRRFEHRDGVQQRSGQRNVDVVHDEHQLAGPGRQPVPAQRGEVLSPTPFPALDRGIAPPSVNAELVTVMDSGASKPLPDNGLRCAPRGLRGAAVPAAPSGAASGAAHGDRARPQHVAEFGRQVTLLHQSRQHAAALDDVEDQFGQFGDGARGSRACRFARCRRSGRRFRCRPRGTRRWRWARSSPAGRR